MTHVPIEDLTTRQQLWHGVWDWLIDECERLARESEQAYPRTIRKDAQRLGVKPSDLMGPEEN